MQKFFLTSVLLMTLAGCTSITTMTPTQFNNLATTQLPFSGSWSGKVGESWSVLMLDQQGKGLLCMDDRKDLISYKVKLVDDVLYTDQGIKFKVKELNYQQANLYMSLLGVGATLSLDKDDQLQNATNKCRQLIKS